MKNLLIVLVLIVLGVAAFGFYRGWFQVSTADADHKANVTFTVDQDKVHQDEQKLKELGHTGKASTEKTGEPNSRP